MKSSKGKLRKQITLEGRIKLSLSIGLIIYSIIVSNITGSLAFIAMLMSFGGDVFLMKRRNCFHNKEKDDFKIGVFLFMLAHIFYANTMNTQINHLIISVMAIIATLYLVTIVFNCVKESIILMFYAIVLILSVVNTFFFNKLAFIGGVIFLISDLLILIFKIKKDNGYIREVSVWGTYILAQSLILTSFFIN